MIKERLKKYLTHKHLSVREFERNCGLGNGVMSRLSSTTSQSTLNKIASHSDLNTDWLFTGEGEMLREAFNTHEEIPSERSIPFYDVETTGGFNGSVANSNHPGNLVGYIQPGGWFDSKETAAIRHVGDSMVEYPNGCILAVREVTERRLLVPGRNYVIETTEFRVTKRVQRGSTPSTIALYSSNTETYPDGRLIHEPFEVEVEDIRRIYSVLGYIVNQSGEFRLIKP